MAHPVQHSGSCRANPLDDLSKKRNALASSLHEVQAAIMVEACPIARHQKERPTLEMRAASVEMRCYAAADPRNVGSRAVITTTLACQPG